MPGKTDGVGICTEPDPQLSNTPEPFTPRPYASAPASALDDGIPSILTYGNIFPS